MSARGIALLLLPLAAAAHGGEDALDLLRRRMQEAKDKVFPALVHIVNVEENLVGGRKERSVSTGSGFFIDALGHIVTNFHVAGTTARLTVTLANRQQVKADLVAGDPYTDVALLRVDPRQAFPDGKPSFATLGSSAAIREGEFVMAMGSPLSLSRSVSFGIVSCRNRILDTMRLAGHETGEFNTWIQTDAAINPGNSGGPLVNLDGEVIGLNTRANLSANNIGFAIPSDVVRDVVRALLAHGRVPRAWLGLRLQPIDAVENTSLGGLGEGVLVAAVANGSPAALAGIRPGDFITQLDGAPFSARFDEDVPDLYRRISALDPARAARLTVSRGGERRSVEVTPEPLGEQVGREVSIPEWGITVSAITDGMQRELGLEDAAGVIVTGISAGSPAVNRLSPGDVVRTVGRATIADLPAFLAAVKRSAAAREPLVRLVYRQGATLDVTVLRPTYPED